MTKTDLNRMVTLACEDKINQARLILGAIKKRDNVQDSEELSSGCQSAQQELQSNQNLLALITQAKEQAEQAGNQAMAEMYALLEFGQEQCVSCSESGYNKACGS